MVQSHGKLHSSVLHYHRAKDRLLYTVMDAPFSGLKDTLPTHKLLNQILKEFKHDNRCFIQEYILFKINRPEFCLKDEHCSYLPFLRRIVSEKHTF
jgi:hypothetical protein